MINPLNRREFLTRSTTGLALAGTLHGATHSADTAHASQADTKKSENSGPKVGVFTKSFQDRPIPEVCRIFQEMGLDGLDLTVRPGGHIEPENVAAELPQAVKAAHHAGIEILFLTTSITDPDDNAERIFQACSEQGIDRVKLGYYRYRQLGTLAEQMDDVSKRLAAVAQLARRYNVLPCVHIHSNAYIPSHGTMLYQLIRDFSPEEIGAYVDSLHMVKEGGGDAWRQGLDLLAPWIALVAIKNFAWQTSHRDETGQQRWKTQTVPVADGVSPIPEFVATLKKLGYAGTYSLHSEYKGRHSFEDLDTDGCIKQTAEDFKFFRPLLDS